MLIMEIVARSAETNQVNSIGLEWARQGRLSIEAGRYKISQVPTTIKLKTLMKILQASNYLKVISLK